MKKIISVLLVMVLALSVFAGCSPKAQSNFTGTATEVVESIVNKALESIDEDKQIPQMAMPLDKEYAAPQTGLTVEDFDKYVEEAVMSAAMIGSQAHSVVVVKVKDGEDVKAVADKMFNKIDMRWWVCVNAEELYVNTSGNYVYAVYSTEAFGFDKYVEAFEALAGDFGTAKTTQFRELA